MEQINWLDTFINKDSLIMTPEIENIMKSNKFINNIETKIEEMEVDFLSKMYEIKNTFENNDIQCSSNKHHICNECMMKWIKECIEKQKDVKCVICNQIIYTFQSHQQRIQLIENQRRQEEEERNREERLSQMTRNNLERNIQNLSEAIKKLILPASFGSFICFGLFIFLPPQKQINLIKFFISYITLLSIIWIILVIQRFLLLLQLQQFNRIHPISSN
jgi:uncharacterized protein YccT (UPF0319 family)